MPRTPSASASADEGDIHFLPKPFGLKQLAGKVKEVMLETRFALANSFSGGVQANARNAFVRGGVSACVSKRESRTVRTGLGLHHPSLKSFAYARAGEPRPRPRAGLPRLLRDR